MSSGFTPVNQVRMTNVAYVRLQKKGKRFEIACYRNKVVSWRNKIETDLQEVLQVDTVFTNVSKGMLASSNDLIEAFGTSDQFAVCKEILDKGEMQVSEQERGALLDSIFRDVASIVVEKSINPENNRPYTISMIQNAMRQIHFSANLTKSSKSQALDVIRKLKAVMPIARASMYLRIICSEMYVNVVKEEMLKDLGLIPSVEQILDNTTSSASATSSSTEKSLMEEKYEQQQQPDNHQQQQQNHAHKLQYQVALEVKVDPDQYRKIEEGVASATGGSGRVEVLQMRVMQGGSSNSSAASNTITSGSSSVLERDSDVSINSEAVTSSQNLTTTMHSIKESNHTESDEDGDGDEEEDDDIGNIVGMSDIDIEKKILKSLKATKPITSTQRDEEDVDDYAIGMAKKNKQKKNKKKVTKLAVLETEDDCDSDDEGEVDGDRIKTKVTEVEVIAPVPATKGKEKDNKDKANKKGKTTKRMEKAEAIEREQRVLKSKLRTGDSANVIVPSSSTTRTTTDEKQPPIATPTTTSSATTAPSEKSVIGAKSCNTCGGLFPDALSYRNHFRSDWHRYNLNRKMKNLPIVADEIEFSKLTLKDLEINSISSS